MPSQPSTRPGGRTDERARPAAPALGAAPRAVRAARRRVGADTPLRVVGAALSGAVVLVVAGLVVLLGIIPTAVDGAALTVLSGSMQPTLRPGDVVVVRGVEAADVCDQVGVGDIVTFLPQPDDPSLVTHRVVAKTVGTYDDGTACRLTTQGDANSAVDDPVSPTQVRGVFWYGLPALGWVKQWLVDNPTTVLVVVVAVATVWWLLPRRRSQVIALPAPADRVPSERELALREREVAVREAELALARTAPAGATPTASPTPQDPGVR